MDKVWFVSEGEYSAYQVVGVFASRELAEQYAQGEKGRYVEPEKGEGFDLVSVLPEPVPWLRLSCVIGGRYGDWEEETTQVVYPGIDEMPVWRTQVTPRRQLESPLGVSPAFVEVEVSGTDIERVRKVFSEKRARALAEFDLLTKS